MTLSWRSSKVVTPVVPTVDITVADSEEESKGRDKEKSKVDGEEKNSAASPAGQNPLKVSTGDDSEAKAALLKERQDLLGMPTPKKGRGSISRGITHNSLEKTIDGIKTEINEAEEARIRLETDPWLRFVESTQFGSAVGALIALNGIMLGVQSDYDFETMNASWQAFGIFQEYFFTCCFCLELCIKFYAYKVEFFTSHDRAWNIFDFVLVSVSFCETFVLPHVGLGDADMGQMSVLRMFRLVRLARLVRLLRVFRQLWLFVVGIFNALHIISWGMLLTLLVIYMSAIYVTRALDSLSEEDSFFHDHFGSMLKSMFTLFQISTGDAWASGVVRPVCRHYPHMSVFFVAFICVTQFAFFNVVVAVIVESVLKQALSSDDQILREAEAQFRGVLRGLYDVFNSLDDDGNMRLSREEFLVGIKTWDVKLALQKVDISLQDAEEMFDILDHDHSGCLKLEEFIDGAFRGRGHAKAKDLLSIQFSAKKTAQRMSSLEQAVNDINLRFDELQNMLFPSSTSSASANNSGSKFSANAPMPIVHHPAAASGRSESNDGVNGVHHGTAASGAIEEQLSLLTRSIDRNFSDLWKRLERLETERDVSAPTATSAHTSLVCEQPTDTLPHTATSASSRDMDITIKATHGQSAPSSNTVTTLKVSANEAALLSKGPSTPKAEDSTDRSGSRPECGSAYNGPGTFSDEPDMKSFSQCFFQAFNSMQDPDLLS